MAYNPLYNTNDSPNGATKPTRSVNEQSVYVPRTHNKFDMSYYNFMTQRFGQYEAFFAMEGVPGDIIPLRNTHEVRTLTMSSPFLTDITLHKDYFMVPNQAIQPNTYEYIFRNPSQGDDVPDDAYNLFPFSSSEGFVNTFFARFFSTFNDLDVPRRMYGLLILETLISHGSLLNQLGYKVNPRFSIAGGDGILSFDDIFDEFVNSLTAYTVRIQNEEISQQFTQNDIDKYTLISLMRRYGSDLEVVNMTSSWDKAITVIAGIPSSSESKPISIDRVCAYQLSCAQYFVNPQVDFIYNAQLYRDNFFTLLRDHYSFAQDYFDMNGVQVPYDVFSLHNFQKFTNRMVDFIAGSNSVEDFQKCYDVIHYLFGFRESLRFGDYFTDSRTRPLAIGDDSVQVAADNTVSVVDVSKRIVYQRFRNAVVKLGNNFGDYLRGIFGTSPSPDYHFPKYIIHSEFSISGNEVANTAGDQGKLVTNVRSAEDHYEFEINVDMPCVIIGISSFSVPRSYCQTKERFFFHQNRFDFFNPMLQYVGDQPVYNEERSSLVPPTGVFGYQSRFNEYKQRYNLVSGAFVKHLPAWTFVTDSLYDPVTDVVLAYNQSPSFIRAHDFEFNRFFAQMPGYSLATGFHFIVKYLSLVESVRPMEVNPNIL